MDVGADAMAEGADGALSVYAFAGRVGVDVAAVRKAIRNGRLERSIAKDINGRPIIADVGLAEQEWSANRAGAKLKGPGLLTMAEERKRLLRAQARRAEIANRKTTGVLVQRRAVEIRYATLVVTAKTKIRGVPSRIKQRVPHLTLAELAIIAELLDEALEELADGR
jgi:hypothetical protein